MDIPHIAASAISPRSPPPPLAATETPRWRGPAGGHGKGAHDTDPTSLGDGRWTTQLESDWEHTEEEMEEEPGGGKGRRSEELAALPPRSTLRRRRRRRRCWRIRRRRRTRGQCFKAGGGGGGGRHHPIPPHATSPSRDKQLTSDDTDEDETTIYRIARQLKHQISRSPGWYKAVWSRTVSREKPFLLYRPWNVTSRTMHVSQLLASSPLVPTLLMGLAVGPQWVVAEYDTLEEMEQALCPAFIMSDGGGGVAAVRARREHLQLQQQLRDEEALALVHSPWWSLAALGSVVLVCAAGWALSALPGYFELWRRWEALFGGSPHHHNQTSIAIRRGDQRDETATSATSDDGDDNDDDDDDDDDDGAAGKRLVGGILEEQRNKRKKSSNHDHNAKGRDKGKTKRRDQGQDETSSGDRRDSPPPPPPPSPSSPPPSPPPPPPPPPSPTPNLMRRSHSPPTSGPRSPSPPPTAPHIATALRTTFATSPPPPSPPPPPPPTPVSRLERAARGCQPVVRMQKRSSSPSPLSASVRVHSVPRRSTMRGKRLLVPPPLPPPPPPPPPMVAVAGAAREGSMVPLRVAAAAAAAAHHHRQRPASGEGDRVTRESRRRRSRIATNTTSNSGADVSSVRSGGAAGRPGSSSVDMVADGVPQYIVEKVRNLEDELAQLRTERLLQQGNPWLMESSDSSLAGPPSRAAKVSDPSAQKDKGLKEPSRDRQATKREAVEGDSLPPPPSPAALQPSIAPKQEAVKRRVQVDSTPQAPSVAEKPQTPESQETSIRFDQTPTSDRVVVHSKCKNFPAHSQLETIPSSQTPKFFRESMKKASAPSTTIDFQALKFQQNKPRPSSSLTTHRSSSLTSPTSSSHSSCPAMSSTAMHSSSNVFIPVPVPAPAPATASSTSSTRCGPPASRSLLTSPMSSPLQQQQLPQPQQPLQLPRPSASPSLLAPRVTPSAPLHSPSAAALLSTRVRSTHSMPPRTDHADNKNNNNNNKEEEEEGEEVVEEKKKKESEELRELLLPKERSPAFEARLVTKDACCSTTNAAINEKDLFVVRMVQSFNANANGATANGEKKGESGGRCEEERSEVSSKVLASTPSLEATETKLSVKASQKLWPSSSSPTLSPKASPLLLATSPLASQVLLVTSQYMSPIASSDGDASNTPPPTITNILSPVDDEDEILKALRSHSTESVWSEQTPPSAGNSATRLAQITEAQWGGAVLASPACIVGSIAAAFGRRDEEPASGGSGVTVAREEEEDSATALVDASPSPSLVLNAAAPARDAVLSGSAGSGGQVSSNGPPSDSGIAVTTSEPCESGFGGSGGETCAPLRSSTSSEDEEEVEETAPSAPASPTSTPTPTPTPTPIPLPTLQQQPPTNLPPPPTTPSRPPSPLEDVAGDPIVASPPPPTAPQTLGSTSANTTVDAMTLARSLREELTAAVRERERAAAAEQKARSAARERKMVMHKLGSAHLEARILRRSNQKLQVEREKALQQLSAAQHAYRNAQRDKKQLTKRMMAMHAEIQDLRSRWEAFLASDAPAQPLGLGTGPGHGLSPGQATTARHHSSAQQPSTPLIGTGGGSMWRQSVVGWPSAAARGSPFAPFARTLTMGAGQAHESVTPRDSSALLLARSHSDSFGGRPLTPMGSFSPPLVRPSDSAPCPHKQSYPLRLGGVGPGPSSSHPSAPQGLNDPSVSESLLKASQQLQQQQQQSSSTMPSADARRPRSADDGQLRRSTQRGLKGEDDRHKEMEVASSSDQAVEAMRRRTTAARAVQVSAEVAPPLGALEPQDAMSSIASVQNFLCHLLSWPALDALRRMSKSATASQPPYSDSSSQHSHRRRHHRHQHSHRQRVSSTNHLFSGGRSSWSSAAEADFPKQQRPPLQEEASAPGPGPKHWKQPPSSPSSPSSPPPSPPPPPHTAAAAVSRLGERHGSRGGAGAGAEVAPVQSPESERDVRRRRRERQRRSFSGSCTRRSCNAASPRHDPAVAPCGSTGGDKRTKHRDVFTTAGGHHQGRKPMEHEAGVLVGGAVCGRHSHRGGRRRTLEDGEEEEAVGATRYTHSSSSVTAAYGTTAAIFASTSLSSFSATQQHSQCSIRSSASARDREKSIGREKKQEKSVAGSGNMTKTSHPHMITDDVKTAKPSRYKSNSSRAVSPETRTIRSPAPIQQQEERNEAPSACDSVATINPVPALLSLPAFLSLPLSSVMTPVAMLLRHFFADPFVLLEDSSRRLERRQLERCNVPTPAPTTMPTTSAAAETAASEVKGTTPRRASRPPSSNAFKVFVTTTSGQRGVDGDRTLVIPLPPPPLTEPPPPPPPAAASQEGGVTVSTSTTAGVAVSTSTTGVPASTSTTGVWPTLAVDASPLVSAPTSTATFVSPGPSHSTMAMPAGASVTTTVTTNTTTTSATAGTTATMEVQTELHSETGSLEELPTDALASESMGDLPLVEEMASVEEVGRETSPRRLTEESELVAAAAEPTRLSQVASANSSYRTSDAVLVREDEGTTLAAATAASSVATQYPTTTTSTATTSTSLQTLQRCSTGGSSSTSDAVATAAAVAVRVDDDVRFGGGGGSTPPAALSSSTRTDTTTTTTTTTTSDLFGECASRCDSELRASAVSGCSRTWERPTSASAEERPASATSSLLSWASPREPLRCYRCGVPAPSECLEDDPKLRLLEELSRLRPLSPSFEVSLAGPSHCATPPFASEISGALTPYMRSRHIGELLSIAEEDASHSSEANSDVRNSSSTSMSSQSSARSPVPTFELEMSYSGLSVEDMCDCRVSDDSSNWTSDTETPPLSEEEAKEEAEEVGAGGVLKKTKRAGKPRHSRDSEQATPAEPSGDDHEQLKQRPSGSLCDLLLRQTAGAEQHLVSESPAFRQFLYSMLPLELKEQVRGRAEQREPELEVDN